MPAALMDLYKVSLPAKADIFGTGFRRIKGREDGDKRLKPDKGLTFVSVLVAVRSVTAF